LKETACHRLTAVVADQSNLQGIHPIEEVYSLYYQEQALAFFQQELYGIHRIELGIQLETDANLINSKLLQN
jgi:hypothetical protein